MKERFFIVCVFAHHNLIYVRWPLSVEEFTISRVRVCAKTREELTGTKAVWNDYWKWKAARRLLRIDPRRSRALRGSFCDSLRELWRSNLTGGTAPREWLMRIQSFISHRHIFLCLVYESETERAKYDLTFDWRILLILVWINFYIVAPPIGILKKKHIVQGKWTYRSPFSLD